VEVMMMRSGNRRRDRQRGVAAVEFALVLPLLLVVVLGAIDWGWYFFIDQLVTNAAREGARAGTLLPPRPTSTPGQAEDAAEGAGLAYLKRVSLSETGVAATMTTVDGTDAISVTITYPVGSLTGFLSAVMPANAVATAVMRW
jgi:Flp pilus assembly protein TadG